MPTPPRPSHEPARRACRAWIAMAFGAALVACAPDLQRPLEMVDAPLVIAHRGASGLLHQHTLAAYALAWGLGADVLEPDLVLTADGVPVCAHDRHVSAHSDVAALFGERADAEGRVPIADLTWEELQRVQLRDEREPAMDGQRYASFEQFLDLADRLEASRGRPVAIMPEAKEPAWHAARGLPMGPPILAALEAHGRHLRGRPTWLQCFDADWLVHVRRELGANVRLLQLFDDMPDEATLDAWLEVVDALGPPRELIDEPHGERAPGWLVRAAHERGLLVFPWTFRGADDVPAMRRFFHEWGVDGLFSDDPDLALAARDDG